MYLVAPSSIYLPPCEALKISVASSPVSTLTRNDNMHLFGEYFDRLARAIERENLLSHFDLNQEIEFVFRDLLNAIYGWDLENANVVSQKNQEGFDLCSPSKRICLQVTSTTSATKIKKTLKAVVPKYQNQFDRLLFVYPVMTLGKTRANFAKEAGSLNFDAKRDRLCFGDILEKARNFDIVRQRQILELVEQELAPLGKNLQLGTEPSVDFLIKVIAHLAQTQVVDPAQLRETHPDAEKKLRRFRDHAIYLKRQFIINRGYYLPVAAARKAVGRDAGHVPRIQLWLQSRSADILEQHGDDPRKSFEALVTQLLHETHSSGRDADRTAVSYLLADEFFRCNVFPNPDE